MLFKAIRKMRKCAWVVAYLLFSGCRNRKVGKVHTVPRNVCYVWVFSLVLVTKSITGGRASLQGICISLCIRKRLGGFYRFNHLPVNKEKKELQTKAPLLFSLVLFLT